jgi:membrane protein
VKVDVTGRLRRLGRSFGSIWANALEGWLRHGASGLSAAIAYYGVFSLAPLVVIMIAILGLFYGSDAANGLIVRQLEGLMGTQPAEFIQSLLANVYRSGSGVLATVFAVIVLLWGASRLVGSVRAALNTIWEVNPRSTRRVRGYLVGKAFDIGLAIGLGVLLLAAMLANTAASALTRYFSDRVPIPRASVQIVGILVSLLGAAVFIAAILHTLPSARIRWRETAVGAATTAVFFTIGNYLIGLYLGRTSVQSVFGAASSLVLIMIWMYYSSQILLLGAELTRAYGEYRKKPITRSSRRHPDAKKPARLR